MPVDPDVVSIAVLAIAVPFAFQVPNLCNAVCDRLRYGKQYRPMPGLSANVERIHPDR